MILIVSWNGIDPQLLRETIAGKKFESHIASQAAKLGIRDFFYIDSSHHLSEASPQIDKGFIPKDDVIVMEADVWLSKKTLDQIRSTIVSSDQKEMIRFTVEKDGEKDALAIFCPKEVLEALFQQFGKDIFHQTHLCQWITDKYYNDSKTIDASQLDSALRPIRIQNRMDLAIVESQILFERACDFILAGVKIRDPRKVFIYGDLECGAGVQIDLDVIFEGHNVLSNGVHIGAHSILKNAKIGVNTRINPFSIVEDAAIGANSFVGPYGRIRPGTVLGDSVQIGNFVEIKNSAVESGGRINHLAFIGDSTLEKNVTIGAGTITCNHNGKGVSHTHIKEGSYIGSGCELVAPLTIGENSTIGAGSTITEDVPSGGLTLARARQVTLKDWSRQEKDPSKK